MLVKTPANTGSHVVETMSVVSEGNNVTVSVTMLSHPNAFTSVRINMPASDGSQDEDVLNVESWAE
jgi:hypothetical protein